MCRSTWIEETIHNAHHSLETGELDAVADILTILDKNKEEGGNVFSFDVEGYPKCSIRKSEYYYEIGGLLSAFPDREKEALEAFCMYNYHQIEKKEGVELEGTKTYYSFRRANEYAFEDLANNTITMVSPKLMNDPLDTLMFQWLRAREQNSERLLLDGNYAEDYKQILRNMGRLFVEAHNYYKIRSFCAWKKDDNEPPYQNTLMWSHYADSHKGFCVVYRISPKMRFKKEDSAYRTLSKINYCKEPLNLINETEFAGEDALLTKSGHWKYEKEFRLLMYDPSKKDDYYPLELDQESYVYAIIFGMKCSEGTKSIIRSIMKDKKIRYYEMREDPSNIYTLKLHELSSDSQ